MRFVTRGLVGGGTGYSSAPGGASIAQPGRLVRATVPTSVPSVFQSCGPRRPSSAVKYTVPPTAVNRAGEELWFGSGGSGGRSGGQGKGLYPGDESSVLMSLSRWVPAGVPSAVESVAGKTSVVLVPAAHGTPAARAVSATVTPSGRAANGRVPAGVPSVAQMVLVAWKVVWS